MKTRVYRIERVVENERMYFQLVRDEDYAIVSSKQKITDVLNDYEDLKENSDYDCILNKVVTTIDNTKMSVNDYVLMNK